MKRLVTITLACLAIAGCQEGRQRSLETRSLDSGVTSSSGGGQSVLHNIPNTGVTNGSTSITGVRNSPTSPCLSNPSLAGC